MSLNKTSKHYNDYYNHVLNSKKTIGVMGKVFINEKLKSKWNLTKKHLKRH